MNSIIRSWRTSLPAAIAFVALAVRIWTPDQSELAMRIEETGAGLMIMLAAFAARDHEVSSEQAGIKGGRR